MNLKKEINLNKLILTILILVSILTIGISISYALFQTTAELDNVIKIKTPEKLNLDKSGLNFPSMLPNFIPISNKENKIVKMDIDNLNKNFQWYDYQKNNFASAVTVKNNEVGIRELNGKKITDDKDHDFYTLNSDGTAYFDGIDDFLSLGGNNENFESQISIIVRVKFHKNITTNQTIFGNNENGGFKIYLVAGNRFRFMLNSTSITSQDAYNLDTWHTVVGTYNGSEINLYIDGVLASVGVPKTGEVGQHVAPFVLGGDSSSGGPPDQEIANVTVSNAMVYKDCLTANEIATYFQGEITNYPTDNIFINKNKFEKATYKYSDYYDINENGDIYFDGEDDFLNLGYADAAFNNTITMIIRTKFHKDGLYQDLFNNMQSGGAAIAVTNYNTIFFKVYVGNGYKEIIPNTTYELEKWYTIVGVYDGSYEHLYINGEEVAEPIALTGSIKNPSPPTPFILSGNATLTGFFSVTPVNATVSDAFVYTDAISKEEVEKYFQGEITDYPTDNMLLGVTNFEELPAEEFYKKAKIGSEIQKEDIIATWDWIPRYSLIEDKIKYNWKIENKDTRDKAFNYNNRELLGYWITKDNNIDIGSFDTNKYDLHNVTTNETNAANKLKGITDTYTKSVCVYGN